MAEWSCDDIPWDQFKPGNVKPEILSLVKAACVVEHNSADYSRYLCEVFSDDVVLQEAVHQWAKEEIQHGIALKKWAELADPEFDFDRDFKAFTEGFKLPQNIKTSIRGSRSGELVARCIVETGTSWYYAAIKDYCNEPVLQEICRRISADELRHYKLFYTYFSQYQEKENIGFFKRLSIAVGRIVETEDDELSYAMYATDSSKDKGAYDRRTYANRYLQSIRAIYKKNHIERMTAMVFKVVGLKPHNLLNRAVNQFAWMLLQSRTA